MVGFAQINSTKRLILSTKREVTSPVHILRYASSRTSFKGGDVTDSILKQYALVVLGGKVSVKTCAKKIRIC